MEASVRRDAVTARIDKSVASLNTDISGILGNVRVINTRLLPPTPTCGGELPESGKLQGWLEETLSGLEDVHRLVNAVRSEVNTLFDAVEAGKVKGEEVK